MKGPLSAMRWVAYKDLARFFADRNGALMTICTPILLGILLGVLFAPGKGGGKVTLLVADLDGGPNITRLLASIEAADTLTLERTSEAEARAAIAAGKASVALILPKGSSDALRIEGLFGGSGVDATLLYDPSRKTEAEIARGLLTEQMMKQVGEAFNDPKALKSLFGKLQLMTGLSPGWSALFGQGAQLADTLPADGAGAGAGGMQPPLALKGESVVAAGPQARYNSYAHNFAGMLCMFLLFWGQRAAAGLWDEREAGTLVRLRLTGASPTAILLGGGLATFVVSLLISGALYLVAILAFGVTIEGSAIGFALVLVAIAAFVAGFSLCLQGVARSRTQIENVAVFVILVLSFAGGATIPVFVFPEWVQSISQAVPTRWATSGLAAMTWRGLPLSAALLPSGLLLGTGAVLAAIGIRRFKWQ